MGAPRNFAFSMVFPTEDELARQEAHRFSEEEVAEIRRTAHAAGVEEGMTLARTALEGQALSLLEALQSKVVDIEVQTQSLQDNCARDVANMVRLVVDKWLPWASQHQAHEEIIKLIEETVRLSSAAKLQVYCAPQMVSYLEGRITPPIHLVQDATLSLGDCRITWDAGGIERRFDRLKKALDEALERLAGSIASKVPEEEMIQEQLKESTDG